MYTFNRPNFTFYEFNPSAVLSYYIQALVISQVGCILHNGEYEIATAYLPPGSTNIDVWAYMVGGFKHTEIRKLCIVCIIDASCVIVRKLAMGSFH